MPADERVFWGTDSCTVWVGGADDVVDLVCGQVEAIMARGKRGRLQDRGIECGFISY